MRRVVAVVDGWNVRRKTSFGRVIGYTDPEGGLHATLGEAEAAAKAFAKRVRRDERVAARMELGRLAGLTEAEWRQEMRRVIDSKACGCGGSGSW